MRVLVCGDREWSDIFPMNVFLAGLEPSVVIHGDARGADRLAGRLATQFHHEVEVYPAKWDEHGKAAGPIRNQQMLDEGKPEMVLAFHDNLAESKGTRDMVLRARKAGVPVYVVGSVRGRDKAQRLPSAVLVASHVAEPPSEARTS